jgi:Mlc titration factor MtfA (ptsG expression regulator)
MREVAGWEHDLHAAMDNIQDEIDLVGKARPVLMPMRQPILLSVLPCYRNIFQRT